MAKWVCGVCGFVFDEDKEGARFDSLGEDWVCPVCGAAKSLFTLQDEKRAEKAEQKNPLAYPEAFAKASSEYERHMREIHQIAVSGESIIEAMSTKLPVISWDDILFLGAQLNPAPLDAGAAVNTTTVIGRHAKKPMELYHPVYVSHMSFGALSRELKTALAKGSAMSKTAMCSGEGGILPEERQAAYKYIFEYVPNLYSVTSENLKSADAIEIKIGQGTKPGMGGHLPGDKVTPEIAAIRNKPLGEDVISPSKFPNLKTKEDLKEMVDWLREESEGRPIGVKIAAGHIESDMEWVAYAKPDFVTVDGRGGATGASPKTLKDASSLPTIYALYRTRKYLDEHHLDMELVITGGLRVPADFAKAIAMGADAVAIASAALMAAACQQYRVCNTGTCPVGVATQDPELRKRLHIEHSAKRLYNFLEVSRKELEMFARITGHENLHDLSVHDLCTVNREISDYTNIPHA
ncbi:MAG: glutamate synthase-related protein [Lachnospiraceae bacterium]|nr:glutamate synthase-related protein [Lachnospiraceae bacterium]MDD3616843.1 glutamate synthase-related protein [Lachnospiraceae bacterium]